MRYLTFLLALLWFSPAYGAVDCAVTPKICRCVGVVYRTSAETVDWFLVPWGRADNIGDRLRLSSGNQRRMAGLHVYYDQFGIQGGPSWFPGWEEAHSLDFLPTTTAEPTPRLVVNEFFQAPSAAQDSSSKNWFVAAADDTEDVGFSFISDTGRGAGQALVGGPTGKIRGVNTQTLSDLAFDIGGRIAVGEIWDEILANGCP